MMGCYGYRGSVLQDEKGSGDWLHDNMNVLTLQKYILKDG